MSEDASLHPEAAAPRRVRVGVVIITRNRRNELLGTLAHLENLPTSPPVVVVDNASSDGTAQAVVAAHPRVRVIRLRENRGAAGRTIGARALDTPYVAFSDDDSWWATDALHRAADLLDTHPTLAVVAAQVLIGPELREDPVCIAMKESPLGRPGKLPGVAVLGFIACGAIVRRSAFLEVGGFHPRLGIGGEEELCAVDLASRAWGLRYVEGITAFHNPSRARNVAERRRRVVRNALWVAWLRRRPLGALRRSGKIFRDALRDPHGRWGIIDAVAGLLWVIRERRPIPHPVEWALEALDRVGRQPLL